MIFRNGKIVCESVYLVFHQRGLLFIGTERFHKRRVKISSHSYLSCDREILPQLPSSALSEHTCRRIRANQDIYRKHLQSKINLQLLFPVVEASEP